MKKAILLLVLIGAISMTETKAQRFITSVGVSHQWGLPYSVIDVVAHDYYGYEVVHAHRDYNHGNRSFNLVLRGPRGFMELNIGHHGHVRTSAYYRSNPLHGHVCGAYCGYHQTYYAAHFRPVVRHHGYNYGHRSNQYDHNRGKHYGHHKAKKYKYKDDRHGSKGQRNYDRGHDRNDSYASARNQKGDDRGRYGNGNRGRGK